MDLTGIWEIIWTIWDYLDGGGPILRKCGLSRPIGIHYRNYFHQLVISCVLIGPIRTCFHNHDILINQDQIGSNSTYLDD